MSPSALAGGAAMRDGGHSNKAAPDEVDDVTIEVRSFQRGDQMVCGKLFVNGLLGIRAAAFSDALLHETAGQVAVVVSAAVGYAMAGGWGAVVLLCLMVALIRWEVFRGYEGYTRDQKDMQDIWRNYMTHGNARHFWVATARHGAAKEKEEVVGSIAIWEIPHDAPELVHATCECHGGKLGVTSRVVGKEVEVKGRCKRHAILRRMSVRRDMRGRRIAGRMMRTFKQFALDNGFGHISFEVSYPQHAATKMYVRHGFLKTDTYISSTKLVELQTYQWYTDSRDWEQ